jgi:hypothetical protein
MLIATAWHSVLRPENPASRSIARICQRNAPLRHTPLLHSRVSPVQKFHATEFLSATHRSATRRVRRDRKPPGPLKRLGRRFNAIPANYIIFGVLGINGVVFAAWSYVQMFQVCFLCSPLRPFPACFEPSIARTCLTRAPISQGSPYVKPPPSARWLARWLQDNFINSYENLRKGRMCVPVRYRSRESFEMCLPPRSSPELTTTFSLACMRAHMHTRIPFLF